MFHILEYKYLNEYKLELTFNNDTNGIVYLQKLPQICWISSIIYLNISHILHLICGLCYNNMLVCQKQVSFLSNRGWHGFDGGSKAPERIPWSQLHVKHCKTINANNKFANMVASNDTMLLAA